MNRQSIQSINSNILLACMASVLAFACASEGSESQTGFDRTGLAEYNDEGEVCIALCHPTPDGYGCEELCGEPGPAPSPDDQCDVVCPPEAEACIMLCRGAEPPEDEEECLLPEGCSQDEDGDGEDDQCTSVCGSSSDEPCILICDGAEPPEDDVETQDDEEECLLPEGCGQDDEAQDEPTVCIQVCGDDECSDVCGEQGDEDQDAPDVCIQICDPEASGDECTSVCGFEA